MTGTVLTACLIYIGILSVWAVLLVCYDKYAAKKRPRSRIRESSLLWLAAAGGAFAMYCSMRVIRHKTRHKKFMIGLPLLFLFHCMIAAAGYFFFFSPGFLKI